MNKRYLIQFAVVAFYFTKSATSWCASENNYTFTRSIPSGIKSKPGSESTQVRQQIRNGTNRFLDFRWINYDGNLELIRPKTDWGFSSIAPNNILRGGTFIGHPFVIVDSINGKLLGCYIFNNIGTFNLVIQETKDGFQLVQDELK